MRRSDVAEALAVDLDEDVPHLAVRDRDEDGRHGAPGLEDDDGGFSVERALLELERRADRLAADDVQQRRDLSPPDDRAADVADAAVAHHTRACVGDEDGVLREHVEQRGNLRVTHVEDVVQQQDRALGGRAALEEDQECHRDLVEHLDAPDASVVQVHWLRQAIAPALLASRARRAELVQAKARDRREEERLGRTSRSCRPCFSFGTRRRTRPRRDRDSHSAEGPWFHEERGPSTFPGARSSTTASTTKSRLRASTSAYGQTSSRASAPSEYG